METERLILRRYLASDAPALAKAANHASVTANMRDRFPSPYTIAHAELWIAENSAKNIHGAILIKPSTPGNPSDSPVLIGSLGVMPETDINYRTYSLGYWLDPAAWGKGYATEAVAAFVRWCFDVWPQLNRIEALTYSKNRASGRVLEKSGFVQEGRRRNNVEKLGVVMDDVIYGVIRSDVGK